MRFSQAGLLAACVPAAVSGRFIETFESDSNVVLEPGSATFLIETTPGKTKWVTEEEKWELRRVCLPPSVYDGSVC